MAEKNTHNLPYTPEWLARWIDSWIARKNQSYSKSYTINRSNIYILPSKSGWLFILSLLAILSGAINYNNSLAYLLCFFLSSLGFIAMLLTHNNIKNITIYPKYTTATFPGNEIEYHFCARTTDNAPHIALETNNKVFSLSDSDETEFSIKEKAKKRGKQRSGRFKLFSEFPLGLFHAWAQVQIDNQVIIYPKPIKYNVNISNFNQGNKQALITDGDDDFSGVRNFKKGDSPKSLAWKTIARTRQLYTKEFTSDSSDTLIFDFDKLDHISNTEERLSILCELILQASKQQLTYGLKVKTTLINPGMGESHRHKCLTALALFKQ